MLRGLAENVQRTRRGAQRTLRGRAKARRIAPRTLRGREEDVQRCSEDAQSTFRGRSEDAPRTRRERSEDAQRARRGRAEDAQRRAEAAQRMCRGRSEARSGVNSKRTSNQQHGSAADTGPAWQSVHPHTLQWSSHLPARVKICAFEPVIAQKVRTHLN